MSEPPRLRKLMDNELCEPICGDGQGVSMGKKRKNNKKAAETLCAVSAACE